MQTTFSPHVKQPYSQKTYVNNHPCLLKLVNIKIFALSGFLRICFPEENQNLNRTCQSTHKKHKWHHVTQS